MISIRPRTPIEYFKILWRRKLLLLITSGVVLSSMLLIIDRLPKVYESRALVAITSSTSGDQQVSADQTTIVSQQLTSRSNLEPLIRRHSLYSLATNMDTKVETMR